MCVCCERCSRVCKDTYECRICGASEIHVSVFESPCAVCQLSANSGWFFTEVHQSPQVVIASERDSINITCSTRGHLEGILMKKIWPQAYNVIYFEDEREPTVDRTFSGRIGFSGSQQNLTITMRFLQLADTGAYTCEAVRKVSVSGCFTAVVVRGKDKPI